MNFLEALELAKKGKKIRLKKWSNPEFYLRSKQDQLYYSDSNKTCSLSISEYVSFDWEIYEGDEKLHSFEEALKALKYDHNVRIRRQNGVIACVKELNFFLNEKDVFANDWLIIENE